MQRIILLAMLVTALTGCGRKPQSITYSGKAELAHLKGQSTPLAGMQLSLVDSNSLAPLLKQAERNFTTTEAQIVRTNAAPPQRNGATGSPPLVFDHFATASEREKMIQEKEQEMLLVSQKLQSSTDYMHEKLKDELNAMRRVIERMRFDTRPIRVMRSSNPSSQPHALSPDQIANRNAFYDHIFKAKLEAVGTAVAAADGQFKITVPNNGTNYVLIGTQTNVVLNRPQLLGYICYLNPSRTNITIGFDNIRAIKQLESAAD